MAKQSNAPGNNRERELQQSTIPDAALVAAFENCSFDAAQFDHTMHVRIAWLYLNEMSLVDAVSRYTRGLKKLTARLGVPEKYHETITWFYLVMINERRTGDGAVSWTDFCRDNPDILSRRPPLVAAYYSDEKIRSQLARRQFILPDMAQSSRSGSPPNTSK